MFIIAIIFAIITLILMVVPRIKYVVQSGPERGETKSFSLKGFGVVTLIITILFAVLASLTVVGTRNVGVPTVFNKPTGDNLGAGLHLKAPWASVTDIDATIQLEEYFGDSAVQVKIKDGGDALVGLSYRWRINPEAADQVFQDYRNSEVEINEAVRSALVTTNVKAAVNEVFGTYDPLANADIPEDATPAEIAAIDVNVVPDYQAFNEAIQENVEDKIKDVGDLVDIQSITLSSLKLPEATQVRINAFNAAVQNTKIANQEVATKAAQAEGNRQLAASLQDPNVLVSQCLDDLASGKVNAPAGYSCWPGDNGSVVVPSAR